MTSDTVTITKEEYELLKEDSEYLQRLEDAGIDEWEGFSAVTWAGSDEDDNGWDDQFTETE